jgi:hypothetical protein
MSTRRSRPAEAGAERPDDCPPGKQFERAFKGSGIHAVSEFFGARSLKNNGGFASVRSKPTDLDVQAGDAIVVRVKGDVREYVLNLSTKSRRMAFSSRTPLPTVSNGSAKSPRACRERPQRFPDRPGLRRVARNMPVVPVIPRFTVRIVIRFRPVDPQVWKKSPCPFGLKASG